MFTGSTCRPLQLVKLIRVDSWTTYKTLWFIDLKQINARPSNGTLRVVLIELLLGSARFWATQDQDLPRTISIIP